MLSKNIKRMTGVALLGFCAFTSPSQAHHPGKVHVVYTAPIQPVYHHKVVVVKKPIVTVAPRRVVVVKPRYNRTVVRVVHRH